MLGPADQTKGSVPSPIPLGVLLRNAVRHLSNTKTYITEKIGGCPIIALENWSWCAGAQEQNVVSIKKVEGFMLKCSVFRPISLEMKFKYVSL